MDLSQHTDLLLRWYSVNKRSLPWRQTRDPYKIWISEVILQQTRVIQGLPYYNRFIERFPAIKNLAKAEIHEVLLYWQGLGYYSRARNLLKCAKTIVEIYGGEFPDSFDELLKLPGIGPYTAAAIASIAFNKKAPVIDGNVYRVLSRLFDINKNIYSTKGKKYFYKIANAMISDKHPGEFNQSIMEFGALQCVPRNPDCMLCDLKSYCLSYLKNNQEIRPVREKKLAKRVRYFDYLVLEVERGIYLRKRVEKDIWNGLYEFFMLETKTKNKDLMEELKKRELFKNINFYIGNIREYKHILTHQIIFASFYHIKVVNVDISSDLGLNNGRFYSLEEIENLPKPVLIDKYLKEEIF